MNVFFVDTYRWFDVIFKMFWVRCNKTTKDLIYLPLLQQTVNVLL